jgi:hypothetical protein
VNGRHHRLQATAEAAIEVAGLLLLLSLLLLQACLSCRVAHLPPTAVCLTCAWLLYGLVLAEGAQLGQLGPQEALQLAPLLLAGDVVQDLPADSAGAAVGC